MLILDSNSKQTNLIHFSILVINFANEGLEENLYDYEMDVAL